MASPIYNDAYLKELERDLVNAGNELQRPPSSNDELLSLLQKVESILERVPQEPPVSIRVALLPAKEALVADELLRHADSNIQVAIAGCLNQVTRITAPDQPYHDDLMKEIFQLFMVVLKHLCCASGRNHITAYGILACMAIIRSCLIMLDMDSDAMVVEMFQLFFDIVRSPCSSFILQEMETIMTLLIEESDKVSMELLTPLLASIRNDNKNVSPVSWELGNTIFEKCATKLQHCVREAVKMMNLDVEDYAEIVASLCHDTSTRNMMTDEFAAASLSGDGASMLGRISEAQQEDCTPQVKDVNANMLDDENSLETSKCSQHTVQIKSNNARSDAEVVNNTEIVQSEMDTEALPRRRSRKPNSLMRPEEGYEHIWILGGTIRKKRRSKNKESMMNQHHDQELSSKPRVKLGGSDIPKKTTKRVIAGSSTVSVDKGEGNHSGTDSERKDELLPQELSERKEIRDEIISQKHRSRDVTNKMVDSPIAKPEKAKYPGTSAQEKGKKSRSSDDYGDELVNLRIMIWWPLDNTFYTGTVEAFDPLTKKHKIKYDDDEEEVLDLKNERWELFNDKQPRQIQSSQKQEADHPSPTKGPVKTEKKIAKRKAGFPRRAASSSKRPKGEGRRFIHFSDDSDD